MAPEEPKIIYEDKDMLAIYKPAGMIVNRSDTTRHEVTLQDWVEERFSLPAVADLERTPQGYETPQSAFKNRAGIVHRLDKETSGIILVAKNVDAFLNLQKQFKDRIVKKTYLA